MKRAFLFAILICKSFTICAQPDMRKYPEPEFAKEVCYLKKDSVNSAIRLEKQSSKMDNKTKVGGMGGFEMSYTIDNSKSKIRIGRRNNLSFVFSTDAYQRKSDSNSDSAMKANGIDPGAMSKMMESYNNPLDNIILYKCETGNSKRKILMQKSGGAFSFNSKIKSSEKYSFSIKNIREGYSELIIDKILPAGEYAFTVPQNGMAGMSGDVLLFAFGVD